MDQEKLDLLLEAERRGILPADKQAALTEARNRGLVPPLEGQPEAPEGKGLLQTIKENIVGDNDPNTQNFGEMVGTAINKVGEAATLGLIGDEASAAAAHVIPGGMDYGERLNYERQQEEMLPPAVRTGAEITGALAPVLATKGQMGLPAATRALPRVLTSAGYGASGAGLYGFMEGEGMQNRADEATIGALLGAGVGAAIPAVGGIVNRVANNRALNKAVREGAKNAPTTEALRREGRALYNAVDDAGVQIKPESFNRARSQITADLADSGLDQLPGPGSLTPKTARVVQIGDEMASAMAEEPTAALPFKSLDQLRRHAGTAARSQEPVDSQLGSRMIAGLDDYVKNLGPDDVVAGDVEALQSALPKARDVWARMSRSQIVDDAIEASENYVSGSASGIRNQFRRILSNENLRRGFSDAELQAMKRVVNGSFPERLVHLFGGGLGQMATTIGGAATGGVPGALAGSATAAGVRGASERLARNNAEIVRALIANGGMKTVPQTSPAVRNVTEALLRRNLANAVSN